MLYGYTQSDEISLGKSLGQARLPKRLWLYRLPSCSGRKETLEEAIFQLARGSHSHLVIQSMAIGTLPSTLVACTFS
jgi:hypothetical protein